MPVTQKNYSDRGDILCHMSDIHFALHPSSTIRN